MSVAQRLGAFVVAMFALAFTRAPGLIRLSGPLMRRLITSGIPAGPNVLLTVRGRKTGLDRTFPVALLDLDERPLLQAASADVAWVGNIRATNEAVVAKGRRRERVTATELDPETAGRALHDLLAPFPRSRLVRAVVGPDDRPPIAVLRYFRVRVDDTLVDYVAVARRQPVFELRRHLSPEPVE